MNVVSNFYPSQYENQFSMPAVQGYQQYPYQGQPISLVSQQPQQYFQQPNFFQPNNNYFFEKNEVLYPDYNTYPEQNDLQSPHVLYNLNRNAQISPMGPGQNFHVYEPYKKHSPHTQSPNSREVSTEEILKKNPHLWNLYQSGRFEIMQSFDLREKKIILREKSTKPDPKYTVTKFKVPVNTTHGSDDGHVLLVSFSNSQIEPSQHIQIDNTQYTYDEAINKPIEHVIKTVAETMPPLPQNFANTHYITEEQKIVGPGSGLVARLVEGGSSCSQSALFDNDDLDESYTRHNDESTPKPKD